jgi:hypothetical protein
MIKIYVVGTVPVPRVNQFSLGGTVDMASITLFSGPCVDITLPLESSGSWGVYLAGERVVLITFDGKTLSLSAMAPTVKSLAAAVTKLKQIGGCEDIVFQNNPDCIFDSESECAILKRFSHLESVTVNVNWEPSVYIHKE